MTFRYNKTEKRLQELLSPSGLQNVISGKAPSDIEEMGLYVPGLYNSILEATKEDTVRTVLDFVFDSFSFEYSEFLHGRCHVLAIVLHQMYGLPLEASLEYDFDIDGMALQHAWVRWNDEYVIDASGVRTMTQLENEFGKIEDFSKFTVKELNAIGGKADKLETEHAKKLARKLYVLAEIYTGERFKPCIDSTVSSLQV